MKKLVKIGSSNHSVSIVSYRCPHCDKVFEIQEKCQINFCPICGGDVR